MILFFLNFVTLFEYCEPGLRIIGGRDALQDEFPYVVRLQKKLTESAPEDQISQYEHLCTGSALTSVWVLTAAHCVVYDLYVSMSNNKIFARYNSQYPNVTGFITPAVKYISHPGYTESQHDVIKLDVLLIQCVNIKISQYGRVNAADFSSLVGHEAFSLGFGRTNASSFEKPLQVLKGMLYKCTENEIYEVSPHVICLLRPCSVEATICGGDSGGPAVHASGIVGVHSMAADNCDENTKHLKLTPGTSAAILSPVSPVIDWITNIIMSKIE